MGGGGTGVRYFGRMKTFGGLEGGLCYWKFRKGGPNVDGGVGKLCTLYPAFV